MQHANHVKLATSRQQGFTLLELLIASIIFAIMAVMAYGGLDNVIKNSESSQQALDRLKQVQQSVMVLNRDLSQIIPRPIRDEYGNQRPYIVADNNIDNLIEFTRGGRVNPAGLIRSTLQRVAYRFDEDKLVRLQWPHLDRSQEAEPQESILVDNVENVVIRFLDSNAEWQEQWPPLNAGGEGAALSPLAVEIVVTLNDWGDIRRIYQVNQ
jgi:general secretion pathway protein J